MRTPVTRREVVLWIVLGISLLLNIYLVIQAVDTFRRTHELAIGHVRTASWNLLDARLRLQEQQKAGWNDPRVLRVIANDFRIVRMRFLAASDVTEAGEIESEQQRETIYDGLSISHDLVGHDGLILFEQAENIAAGDPVRHDILDNMVAQHEAAMFPSPKDWEDDAAFMHEVCRALARYKAYRFSEDREDDHDSNLPIVGCLLYTSDNSRAH
jgi:hypothetical protein